MKASYRPFYFAGRGVGRPTVVYRPVAEVLVAGPRGNGVFRGRIDTGADETILPWRSIESLGVQLLPGASEELTGLGGSERAMFGWVDLEFSGADGPIRWSHLAAFSPSDRTLFGLNGFLEYFVARLDGVKREIGLRHRGKSPGPRFLPPVTKRSR